jgi:glycosyltransferase involved in cell wall biosynthesis
LNTLPAPGPELSVVVAVYNERTTIEEILRRIQAVEIEKEIIIIDDASTDGTREFLMGLDARIKSATPATFSEEGVPNAVCGTATPGCAMRAMPSEEGISNVRSHPNFDNSRPLGNLAQESSPLSASRLGGIGAGRSHPGSDSPLPLGEDCKRSEQAAGVPLSGTGAGRLRELPADAETFAQHETSVRSDEIRIFFQEKNCGKGAALRRGFNEARGQIVIIQDADLEYDPQDYFALIEPIRRGQADVVYGSRFLGGPHRVLLFWHYVGNRLLTTLSNMLTDLNLSDVWTCYKAFNREVLQRIDIQEDRFGFEQEITVKISKNSWRVYEVPISYFGRNYAEGKKITWKDGFRGLWCILRYSLKT